MKRRRNPKARPPLVESLEGRRLFAAVVGPAFQTPLADAYWIENTPALAATLTQYCQLVKIIPPATAVIPPMIVAPPSIAGALQFTGTSAWTGSSFSLTISSGDSLGVAVNGTDVQVTIAGGETPSTWQNVADALNASTDFQALDTTVSLSGSDGPATELSTTTITPSGSGLQFTGDSDWTGGSFSLTITQGDSTVTQPSVAVNGTDVQVTLAGGDTPSTWQDVADALTGSTDFQNLDTTVSVYGPNGDAATLSTTRITPTGSGLQFAGNANWNGGSFMLTITSGDALGVVVNGTSVAVTLVGGDTPSTWQDVADALNGNSDFQNLNVTASVSGTNDPAAVVSTTTVAPSGAGLQVTASAGAKAFNVQIIAASGGTAGESVSGNNVTISIVPGTTTWQNVVDLLNNDSAFTGLDLAASPAGPGSALAALSTQATYDSGLTWTAPSGAAGNNFSVAIVNGTSLGVAVNGTAITVTINSGVTTLQNIIDAANASTDFQNLHITVALQDTDAIAAASSQTNFAGGADQPLWTRIIGIDGTEITSTSGKTSSTAPLIISAVSDNPDLVVGVPTGTIDANGVIHQNDPYVKLDFYGGTDYYSATSMGSIIFQLYDDNPYCKLAVDRFIDLASAEVIAPQATWLYKPDATKLNGILFTARQGGLGGNNCSVVITEGTVSSGDCSVAINSTNSDETDITVTVDATLQDIVTAVNSADSNGNYMPVTAALRGTSVTAVAANGTLSGGELGTLVNATKATWLYKPVSSKTNGILFTSTVGGLEGNDYSVAIQTGTPDSGNCSVELVCEPTTEHPGPEVVVTISAGATLQDIVSAVNAAGLPVTAALQGASVTAVAAAQTNLAGGALGKLPKGATSFYNSDIFVHRVIPGFMVQMGDAVLGALPGLAGTGGSGLGSFDDEYDPNLGYGGEGQLALANSGADTNDCQFFVTEFDSTDTLNTIGTDPSASGYTASNWPTTWLDGANEIFGQMISGESVLQALANAPADTNSYIFANNQIVSNPDYNRPTGELYLQSMEIINSSQDGTIELTAQPGFTGTAHVTITLQDAKGRKTTKVITIAGKSDLTTAPTINDLTDQDQTLPPGGHAVLDGSGTVNSAFLAKYTATATDSKVQSGVTVDAGGNVTVDVPSDYSGIFTVTETVTDGTTDSTGNNILAFAEWGTASTSFRVYAVKDTETWGDTGDNANSIAVFGNMLYEALGSYGLKVYDITDPANPVLARTYQMLDSSTGEPETNSDGSPVLQYRDVKVIDQVVNNVNQPVVYATNQSGGVDILIDDPNDPTKLMPLAINFYLTITSGDSLGVTVNGAEVQVTIPDGAPPTWQQIVAAINANPDFQKLNTTVSLYGGDGSATDLSRTTIEPSGSPAIIAPPVVAGALEFTSVSGMTGSNFSLTIAQGDDTITEASVTVTGTDVQVVLPGSGTPSTWQNVADALNASTDFQALNVTASLSGSDGPATELSETAIAFSGLEFTADYTYVHNFNNSSTSYSIATILHEVNGVMYAVVPGVPMYQGMSGQVAIYNVTDPTMPSDPSYVSMGKTGMSFNDPANVVFRGNMMYVADLAGAIFMFTDTNFTAPQIYNVFGTGGEPWGMSVQGNDLYVADLVKGLLVYDVSSGRPRVIGQYKTPTEAYDVQVRNQDAFVFTAGGTLSLLVNDLRKITPEDTFNCAGTGSPVFDGDSLLIPAGKGFTSMDATSMLDRRVATSVPTTFTDGNGHVVTVSGTNVFINVITSGEGSGTIDGITVSPLKAGGSVKISVAGGQTTTTGDVTIEGSLGLKSFTAPSVELDGDFTVYDGPISSITLGDISAGHTLTVNSSGKGFSFTAGDVTDFNIHADSMPITSIKVNSWTDTDNDPTSATPPAADIQTIGIGKITSAGDFEPDIQLSGYNSTTKTALGSATVGGYIENALWNVTGAIGNITAALGVKDARIESTGSMGTLSLGSADAADFLAGISPANPTDRHATAAGQFNSLASIKGITIKGIKGQTAGQDLLADSNFSAATIGASTLLNVDTSGAADNFGLFTLQNAKKTQLRSVKIGQYGSKTYSKVYSSLTEGDYSDGQLVLDSLA